MRQSHLDPRAVALLLLCCLLWGINQVAAKAALTEIGPLWQAGLRSVVAGALVWLWSAGRGIRLFERDGSLGGGLLAGLLFAAEFACIFVGLQYTSASRMVVFIYLSPFVVALGMPWIARGETLSARQWAGLVLAFGAVAFAFAEGFSAPHSPRQWWGDALGVLAAVLWGGTTLAIRATKLSAAPAEKTLLYQLAVSIPILAGGAEVFGERIAATPSAVALGALTYQVLVVGLTYSAWFALIVKFSASRLSAFTFLTPLFGVAAGNLVLGEPLPPAFLVAVALVAGGLILVNRPR